MNKLIILFGFLGSLLYPPHSTSNTTIPSDGLIAYYSFNDCDAFDQSGNGSHGQIYGSGECRCGVEGNGLLLNGQTDYIEFEGKVNDYFTTSDLTVSFYFKPIGNSIFKQSLLSKRSVCENDHSFEIFLDQQNQMMKTDFVEEEFKEFGDLDAPLEGGAWHHFALVRSGVKAYTYINGKLMNEARRCSGVDIANDTPLSIGNGPCIGNGARRFHGIVDELRIYEKPLTHDEVLNLYSKMKIEDAEKGCVS